MTRRAVGFFKLTEDDLSDENIDAIAEAIVAAILESGAAVAANGESDDAAQGVRDNPVEQDDRSSGR
jgi:hypothetical protein